MLWLWYRSAAAVPIQPLAWELLKARVRVRYSVMARFRDSVRVRLRSRVRLRVRARVRLRVRPRLGLS